MPYRLAKWRVPDKDSSLQVIDQGLIGPDLAHQIAHRLNVVGRPALRMSCGVFQEIVHNPHLSDLPTWRGTCSWHEMIAGTAIVDRLSKLLRTFVHGRDVWWSQIWNSLWPLRDRSATVVTCIWLGAAQIDSLKDWSSCSYLAHYTKINLQGSSQRILASNCSDDFPSWPMTCRLQNMSWQQRGQSEALIMPC